MADVYSWRLKNSRMLEIFISDRDSRRIVRTLHLSLAKDCDDEQAERYMEQHYPQERLVDEKAAAEDRDH